MTGCRIFCVYVIPTRQTVIRVLFVIVTFAEVFVSVISKVFSPYLITMNELSGDFGVIVDMWLPEKSECHILSSLELLPQKETDVRIIETTGGCCFGDHDNNISLFKHTRT